MSIKAEIILNPKIITPRFRELLSTTQNYVLVTGGSSSGKSYNIFSMVPSWLLQGRQILGIRLNATNVRKSIFLEVKKAIIRQKLSKYFTINKTEMSIISNVGIGSMMMTGCADIELLKSVTPLVGTTFDLCIIEEATEIRDEDTFMQILARQRGYSVFPIQTILLFNPININHWIYDRFFKPIEDEYNFNNGIDCVDYEDATTLIHKSTYLDNPYVGDVEIRRFEDMKLRSKSMHSIYANGNFGVMGELVFEDNIEHSSKVPLNIDRLPIRCGIDHGYNDYETFIISRYDEINNKIYIIDTIQKRKMLPKPFAVLVKKMLEKHKISQRSLITADTSDPTKNDLFKQYGLNVQKAVKGGGSKFTGIMWLKGNTIIIPPRLKELTTSFNSYVWKKVRGVVTDDTEHTGSDLIDAIRYAYEGDTKAMNTYFGRV